MKHGKKRVRRFSRTRAFIYRNAFSARPPGNEKQVKKGVSGALDVFGDCLVVFLNDALRLAIKFPSAGRKGREQ